MQNLHRQREPDVRFVGLFGHRRALSREPRGGRRRCRSHRPHALELRSRHPNGRLHGQGPYEIDGMIENERLEEEAEEIRRETAEGSPEVAEHDLVADLQRQLEEANSKVLYAAAEIQNVRRRLETEKQQAANYATTQFARDMLAIKDHLERALSAVSEELRGDKVAS